LFWRAETLESPAAFFLRRLRAFIAIRLCLVDAPNIFGLGYLRARPDTLTKS